jgi:hypothetical protein
MNNMWKDSILLSPSFDSNQIENCIKDVEKCRHKGASNDTSNVLGDINFVRKEIYWGSVNFFLGRGTNVFMIPQNREWWDYEIKRLFNEEQPPDQL